MKHEMGSKKRNLYLYPFPHFLFFSSSLLLLFESLLMCCGFLADLGIDSLIR